MSEIERVEEIRIFFNFNKKTFTKILGNSTPQSYTNFLNGTSGLSMKMIKALKGYDSRINIDWLLTGEGEMLLVDREGGKGGEVSNIRGVDNAVGLDAKEVEYLKKEISYLKQRLEDKDKLISLLEQNQKK